MLRTVSGPLIGLGGQLLLLAGLAGTAGLGQVGWAVGGGCGLIVDAALARALWHRPEESLGPAGWVTLARATLAVGVAALAADSWGREGPAAVLVALAAVALALDWLDGWVARRTKTASALGARMDGEADAFLILALSVAVAPAVGMWVLVMGVARYAFLAAGWPFAWMRAPLPPRPWRKVVTAVQGIALTVAAAEMVPPVPTRAALALALALLAESFGRDVWWLWRQRHASRPRVAAARGGRHGGAVVLTLLALLVVWVALVAPHRPWLLTPAAFVRLPLEGIAIVALAVAVPSGARRLLPWIVGPGLGLVSLAKLLDLGFFVAFDRPFNPVDDWSYASSGVEWVRRSFGSRQADLAVAATVLIGVAALLFPTLAVRRLAGVAARHRRRSLAAAAAAAALWVLCWALGARLVPGVGIASTSAASLAVGEVRAVASALRDRGRFQALLAAPDPYRHIPAHRLLARLRGKDVLLVFVESYGRLALEEASLAPAVGAVLEAATRQLEAAGFSSRSGWLTSPAFGGGSWLAHSTLQAGVWVDSQERYRRLVASDRFTLSAAFRRAGWRTVGVKPAINRGWPEGYSFYRYHQLYTRRNLGYRGPRYGFATMPDQYVLLALQRRELARPRRRPLFAEVDLVSSHAPWARIPPLIAWSRVGDGSIFHRLPAIETGLAGAQQGYARSIGYSLRALFSFLARYGGKSLVLVVLGDHQPSHLVSGYRVGHDVPISVIAHDRAVMRRLAGWGWREGLRPDPTGPAWPMSAFRNRFLRAYGS